MPRRLSVLSYALANVVIDIESLYHLLRHDWPVHRWAHTFLAAGPIGALTGLALVGLIRGVPIRTRAPFLKDEIAPGSVVLGGFLGGITHPLLDGLMHRDIRPFEPFSSANPLLDAVPLNVLLGFCVVSGLVGVAILLVRGSSRKPLTNLRM